MKKTSPNSTPIDQNKKNLNSNSNPKKQQPKRQVNKNQSKKKLDTQNHQPQEQAQDWRNINVPGSQAVNNPETQMMKDKPVRGQSGFSEQKSAAFNVQMKNQPQINDKPYPKTILAQHVSRSSQLVDASAVQRLIPPAIYALVMYDLTQVQEFLERLTLLQNSLNVTAQTSLKESEIQKLHLAAAYAAFAQQLQASMTLNEEHCDPLKQLSTLHVPISSKLAQIIRTCGNTKTELGHIRIGVINQLVCQFYLMSISTMNTLSNNFKVMLGYQPSVFAQGLPTVGDISRTVFSDWQHMKSNFVIDKLEGLYAERKKNKSFISPFLNTTELYIDFQRLQTMYGRNWALLVQDPIVLTISNILNDITLGRNYDPLLPNVGIAVTLLSPIETIQAFKAARKVINFALNKQTYPHLVLEPYQPLPKEQVYGRWQLVQSDTDDENVMSSMYLVTKDEVRYAKMLNFVRKVKRRDPIILYPNKTIRDLITDSLKKDIKDISKQ